jgi:uncharacterized protein (TIRG00374 family)
MADGLSLGDLAAVIENSELANPGRGDGFQWLKRHWRLLVTLLVVGVILSVVWAGRGEVRAILALLDDVRPQWLAIAILVQFVVYLTFSTVYWRSLALLGHRVKLLSLYGLSFVAILLGRVFPAGGASTYAFLLYQLRRRGVPDGVGAIAVTLDGLSFFAAFFALLLGGFVYLFTHGELRAQQMLVIVVLVLAIIFAVMYVWALHYDRPLLTRRALALKNRIAKVFRRSWSDTGLLAFIAEIYDGLALVKRNPWAFMQLVGLQFLALLLDSLTLFCLFLAVNVNPHPSVVLLGYSLANFISSITSLPGGGGSFEAAMTLTFRQLDMSYDVAISVTLLYRLLAFWLPLLITALIYQRIHKRPSTLSPAEPAGAPPAGSGS